jgi:hypothetical protein
LLLLLLIKPRQVCTCFDLPQFAVLLQSH